MYTSDIVLTGERYRTILRDLSLNQFQSLETFIAEFKEFVEEAYSDAFVHKMQTICRFLIDIQAYDYLIQILSMSEIIGTFESVANEGEESVITYATRKIEDETILVAVIRAIGTQIFVPYFFEFPAPSIVAVDLEKYAALKALFEQGICIENIGYGQWTILQHAAANKKYALAEFVLTELGHSPDLCNLIGMPPICFAVVADDFKMVELLIKHGAKIFAMDGDGKTALDYCRSEKMVEILKKHGS